MVFASFLFHASMILSGMGPKILANPPLLPHLASSDVSFPVPIALVSEDADELVAWRNATPVADHPSLCMLLIAEKPFGKHANLVLPFVNVTPSSDEYSPAVSCFSGDGTSLCARVAVKERAAMVQFALTGILARVFFSFRLVASSVEDVLVGSTCFLDVLVAALTSKLVELTAAVFPFWGMVPFLFRHLTFVLFTFLSAIIPYRMIVKSYHYCIAARPRAPVYDGVHFARVEDSATTSVYQCPWLFQPSLEEKALLYYSPQDLETLEEKALLYYSPQDFARFQLESRAERQLAAVSNRVHFACVEGSATTSVRECPRLFKTLEEKALLYYSPQDFARFQLESRSERQFCNSLMKVLMTKQEDQAWRMYQWRQQLQEQSEWKLHRGTKREAQETLGRTNSKRRRLLR
jgi:hypothetical protein